MSTAGWKFGQIRTACAIAAALSRGRALGAIASAAVVSAGLALGCADPLLTPEEPRSQFDRYDAVRDQRAPSYVTDEFGIRRPNLRGRLTEKE
mgnify:CR=1 FL=1